MRRVGKTTVMCQHLEYIRSVGIPEGNICHINLDLYGKTISSEELKTILEPCLEKEGVHYVLIDEIQDVIGWELIVAMLIARKDCDVYITGSNSRMLSSELSTKLSGRYMEINVLPLSFKEYLELHNGDCEEVFHQYLRYGPLPSIEPERGDRVCFAQSEGTYNTVLMKDVVSHLSGRADRLEPICRFLFSNIKNITNAERMSIELKISNDSMKKYLDALVKAHLFYHADRYDVIGKKIFSSKGKYYATDIGMRNFLLNINELRDISALLENIVFFELIRRGYRVFIGSFRDQEVDFTAIKENRIEYYQVSQTVMADETYSREVRPLKSIKDNYPKTVLTLDRFGLGNDEGIGIVNLIDWLLERPSYRPWTEIRTHE
ncbi:MAG: ATP-binding protein [archaeon]|nr:ATP-binding protein [archaeon]